MLSKLFHKKKNGFTLIELLLVCSAFAILVSGVIIAISRAYSFMNDTKIRIRATNFAREGVEMMFNIRDTNWRRHSGERDENRLNTGIGEDTKFQEGLYVLTGWTTAAGDKQFYAEPLNLSQDMTIDEYYSDEGFWNNDNNEDVEIQFEGDYSFMEYENEQWVPKTRSIQEVLTNETEFYRIVRVFGIYCKDSFSSDDRDSCLNASDPKEMRFCVKVFYTNGSSRNSSELCSIMTNFME